MVDEVNHDLKDASMLENDIKPAEPEGQQISLDGHRHPMVTDKQAELQNTGWGGNTPVSEMGQAMQAQLDPVMNPQDPININQVDQAGPMLHVTAYQMSEGQTIEDPSMTDGLGLLMKNTQEAGDLVKRVGSTPDAQMEMDGPAPPTPAPVPNAFA